MSGFQPANPDFEARVRDSFARQPFMEFLGAELGVVEPGYCEIHLAHRAELTQQHGYMHGGALATLADNAAGYAAFSLMPADASVLTVEYKLNIMRPGVGDRMTARAKVIKAGRTITVVESNVYGIDCGKEVMCVTSIQTIMALHGREDR